MKKIKYTTKTYADKINQLSQGEYTVLGKYTRSANKILVRHNPCGTEFEIVAGQLITLLNAGKSRCKHCSLEKAKINKEDFLLRVNNFIDFDNDYELVGDYKSRMEHVTLKHKVCGHTWDIRPDIFLRKRKGCPYCSERGHVDIKDAQERLDKLCNKRFEIIDFQYASHPITVRDRMTGEQFTVRNLRALEQGGEKYRPCVHQKREKTDNSEFQKLQEQENPSFLFEWLTPFKAQLHCQKCGHIFAKTTTKIKTLECPQCKEATPKKGTHDCVVKQLQDLGDSYELLSQYEATSKKALFLHKSCNTKFWCEPARILFALRHTPDKNPCCPTCQGVRGEKKTKESYQRELDLKTNNSFTVLSDYVDEKTPILVRHKCGNEYYVTPRTLNEKNQFSSCPACSKTVNSKGSLAIEKYLLEHDICFSKEYTFSDLKDQAKLKFDFAIMDNDHLLFLLEFDGLQHFSSVEIFGGQKALQRLQKHDKMKDTYCLAHGYNLERISYKEENNIEQIMDTLFHKYVTAKAS